MTEPGIIQPAFSLFHPRDAERYLDRCLAKRHWSRPATSGADELHARATLALLKDRVRVALSLWSLPTAPDNPVAEMLGLPEGAHPCRMDAYLAEMERQGRLPDPMVANLWRRSMIQRAECLWRQSMAQGVEWSGVAARRLRDGEAFIHALRVMAAVGREAVASAPSPSGHTSVSYSTQLTTLGSDIRRAMDAAVWARNEWPERQADPTPEAQAEARAVVLQAMRDHEAGRPIGSSVPSRGDLVLLASSPDASVRLLGLVLGADVPEGEAIGGAGGALVGDGAGAMEARADEARSAHLVTGRDPARVR